MKLFTASEMQALDVAAVESGLDSFALMVSAGEAVAAVASRYLIDFPSIATVVCGPGNNGGDGAVAAESLRQRGFDVEVVRVGTARPGSDAERAFAAWRGTSHLISGQLTDIVVSRLECSSLIVDALLGAGLSRPIQGVYAALVTAMNAATATIVSVDLPSGLDGDEHLPQEHVVQADASVAFVAYKPAHLSYPGRGLCGELHLFDIGMPRSLVDAAHTDADINHPSAWLGRFATPEPQAHKYTRGHVLVRSGDACSSGAARLSAEAALTSGAGAVTLVCSRSASLVNACHLTTVMLHEVDTLDQWQQSLQRLRPAAVVLGPGNGVDDATRESVLATLDSGVATVLDADALSVFSGDVDTLVAALRDAEGDVILTPHAGEFERVFAKALPARYRSRVQAARWVAEHCACSLILKGPDTLIASADGRVRININAPPWLATAGSGDVLAGLAAALVAQGLSGFDAASMAVWCHAEAGLRQSWPLTAPVLIDGLPSVLADLVDCRFEPARVPERS